MFCYYILLLQVSSRYVSDIFTSYRLFLCSMRAYYSRKKSNQNEGNIFKGVQILHLESRLVLVPTYKIFSSLIADLRQRLINWNSSSPFTVNRERQLYIFQFGPTKTETKKNKNEHQRNQIVTIIYYISARVRSRFSIPDPRSDNSKATANCLAVYEWSHSLGIWESTQKSSVATVKGNYPYRFD